MKRYKEDRREFTWRKQIPAGAVKRRRPSQ